MQLVPGESRLRRDDSTHLRRIAGTTWRLVRFEGGDGTVLTPDDGSKYTVTFEADGRLAARIDCNRGSGTWTSTAPSHLELGPLALTRAMCPPGSLHDQIVRQLPYVGSYVLREGRLFLSLMADGGIYELEPTGSSAPPTGQALEGTRWRFTHLDGAPVPVDAQQTEAHLLFGPTGGRLTGSPPLAFLAVPMGTLLSFAVLAGLGICWRGQRETHRRLMLLATIALLPPAFARFRWFGPGGPPMAIGGTCLLVVTCMLWDRRLHGRIHRAFLWGGGLLIVSLPLRFALTRTEGWLVLASWLTR